MSNKVQQLLASWKDPKPATDLRSRVWARIDQQKSQRILIGTIAWAAVCIVIGVVSAEIRATNSADIPRIATIYVNAINPLLRE